MPSYEQHSISNFLMTEQPSFDSLQGLRYFSSHPAPHRFWGSFSLFSWGSFLGVKLKLYLLCLGIYWFISNKEQIWVLEEYRRILCYCILVRAKSRTAPVGVHNTHRDMLSVRPILMMVMRIFLLEFVIWRERRSNRLI